MDAPERTPTGSPSSASVALYEDSPFFDFINSLSPIATPKPLGSTQNVHLFKSPSLAPVSSIFTSPQVNPQKESISTVRDVKLSQEELNPNCQRNQMGTSSGIELPGSAALAEPFGSYIQSAADDSHVYCADEAAGVATNHDQEMFPAVIQNQLASNDYNFDTLKVSSDGTAISQQQHGTHRRNIFNDNVGPSNKRVQNVSNIHHASICGNNYLKPVLPGCLHLNTVASNLSNMPLTVNPPPLATVISGSETALYGSEVCTHVDDYSSQKAMPNADESDQQSHKKRRRKLQKDDGESCRRCSCKKSKCLKLHEEAVSSTRKQTESRNPLAFAPTVIRTFGVDSSQTPASARHRRGCNCRKSSCLKNYCECFQSGVGCSISCRCKSCKNSFGKREGVLLLTSEKLEKGGKAKGTHGKEEKLAFDKHHVISQSGDLAASENLLATPSLDPYRSSFLLPSTCSKLTPATAGCSSELHNPRSPMKPDVLLSPAFKTRAAAMFLGNGFSDIQEVLLRD